MWGDQAFDVTAGHACRYPLHACGAEKNRRRKNEIGNETYAYGGEPSVVRYRERLAMPSISMQDGIIDNPAHLAVTLPGTDGPTTSGQAPETVVHHFDRFLFLKSSSTDVAAKTMRCDCVRASAQ